jgi:hypothetical protein
MGLSRARCYLGPVERRAATADNHSLAVRHVVGVVRVHDHRLIAVALLESKLLRHWPEQIPAARVLAGWSQQRLAANAEVSLQAIGLEEVHEVDETLSLVCRRLARASLDFLAAAINGPGGQQS